MSGVLRGIFVLVLGLASASAFNKKSMRSSLLTHSMARFRSVLSVGPVVQSNSPPQSTSKEELGGGGIGAGGSLGGKNADVAPSE